MSDAARNPAMLGAHVWARELEDIAVVREMTTLMADPPEIMLPDVCRRVLVLDHEASARGMLPLRDSAGWRSLVDQATEHGPGDLLR